MTRTSDAQEPLLTAVARKLGQAAGTLANMTHMLTTDKVTTPSQLASKPESSSPRSADKETNSSTARASRKKTRRSIGAKKRTRAAKRRTASGKNPSTTKGSSRRKNSGHAQN